MDQPPLVVSVGQPGPGDIVSTPVPIRAESVVLGWTVESIVGRIVSLGGRRVSVGILPTVSIAVVSGFTRTVAPVSVVVTAPVALVSSSSVFRAQASEIANAPMSA
ncbi:MAG TPA: hypothetical protein VHJ69_02890 [Gemmatimonadales bacterium]|nr:hypothetical protein [Gemmatimonadales bacterium]